MIEALTQNIMMKPSALSMLCITVFIFESSSGVAAKVPIYLAAAPNSSTPNLSSVTPVAPTTTFEVTVDGRYLPCFDARTY